MALDPIKTLQRLVRTPSVNPMGCDVWDSHMGEERMTDVLIEIARHHGWRYSRQSVHPRRDNLLILIDGVVDPCDGGELLLWDVHQDTVAIEGMTVDPFGGEVRDGRVYGRGACDVKGSMAAMLAGLSRRCEVSPSRGPTVVLACTANEECGFTGAKALPRAWGDCESFPPLHESTDSEIAAGGSSAELPIPRRPDAAIVAEPTDLNAVVAHQGVVRWRCHTMGLAAHTSRPDEGINAVYAMSRVVQAIEAYHRELAANAPVHALCGRPSVCVSRIRGGVGVNTVPDHAVIEIDRRLSPGEAPSSAYEHLAAHIATHADDGRARIVHDEPFMLSVGLSDAHNRALANRLSTIAGERGRRCEITGVPYGTNAAAIAASGVPTVVFGPGSIAQAHTADEFIDIGELEQGAEIFYRIAVAGVR